MCKFGYIYIITNKINNKVYIGQTVGPIKDRFREHCKHRNIKSAINSSIKKYGKDKFNITELCCALSKSSLDYLEILFINKYNSIAPNGYNLKSGGSRGRVHESTKIKLREALLGKPSIGKTKKGWGHYQNKPIISTCLKSGVEICYPSTEITKELGFTPECIHACLKRRWRNKSHKGHFWRYAYEPPRYVKIEDVRKSVKCVHLATKQIRIFKSITEAARFTGANRAHISACCKNRYGRKSANGYEWSYNEDGVEIS